MPIWTRNWYSDIRIVLLNILIVINEIGRVWQFEKLILVFITEWELFRISYDVVWNSVLWYKFRRSYFIWIYIYWKVKNWFCIILRNFTLKYKYFIRPYLHAFILVTSEFTFRLWEFWSWSIWRTFLITFCKEGRFNNDLFRS